MEGKRVFSFPSLFSGLFSTGTLPQPSIGLVSCRACTAGREGYEIGKVPGIIFDPMLLWRTTGLAKQKLVVLYNRYR